MEAWKWLRDGLEICAAYNNKVGVLVEYKIKEPRTHCFVSHAAKVLLLLQGLENVGILLDIGHSLAAGENIAEAAALLSSYGKLDYIHLNDNYRAWDDDMIFGSVHLVEALEFIYWLRRVNYKGWLTLDIFPYREDGVRAAIQCRDWIQTLFRTVDQIGPDSFAKVIQGGDACAAVKLVRCALGGRHRFPENLIFVPTPHE